MEAFCIDEGVDEELAGLMEDLSREFLGVECPVYSQPSESKFQSDEEVKDCEDEDCEDDDLVDSQSAARNYVENCVEADEECSVVGSGEEIEGIFRAGCSCEKKFFAKLRFEVVFDYRLQLGEFSREENEILLLSKLQSMEVRSENASKRSRQRFRTRTKYLLTLCILVIIFCICKILMNNKKKIKKNLM